MKSTQVVQNTNKPCILCILVYFFFTEIKKKGGVIFLLSLIIMNIEKKGFFFSCEGIEISMVEAKIKIVMLPV